MGKHHTEKTRRPVQFELNEAILAERLAAAGMKPISPGQLLLVSIVVSRAVAVHFSVYKVVILPNFMPLTKGW